MSTEQMADFIRAATADPRIREAIAVSAPSLSDLVTRVVDGAPLKRSQLSRAFLSLTRYLIRARSRSTPFGILAGVCPVVFASGATTRVGEAHRKHVRADGAWMAAVVEDLECRPEVLRELKLVVSDLCVIKGNRLHIPAHGENVADGRRSSPRAGHATVRINPVIRRILESAAQPIGYRELLTVLCANFPSATEAKSGTLITRLIKQNVLLTDLYPPLDASDPLDHVLDRLAELAEHPVVAKLHELRAKISDFQETAVGDGGVALEAATRAAQEVHGEHHSCFFQVDMRSDARVSLPTALADEAARAVSALWRMSPVHGEISQELSIYHARFLERYEPGTLVPLVEMLDPELGLGLPEGYGSDAAVAGPEHQPADPSDEDDRRRALLAELALTAIERGGREVVLSDELVDQLARNSPLPPTPTAEVYVQVIAESIDHVTEGDFRLAIGALSGSWQIGATFGRFADLLPELDASLRDGLVHGLPGATLPAQLSYRPGKAATANVVKSPQWTDRSIMVGQFCSERDRALRAGDILVGADEDGFYLTSPAVDGEIAVVVPNMLNPDGVSTPPSRFLREIAPSGRQGWYGWKWGDYSRLPHLPRVRYGRTILSPECWRPTLAMTESAGNWEKWRDALADWRSRYEVPREIRVCADDRQLIVDLDDPVHQRLFHDELHRKPHVRIEEPLGASDEGTDWLHGYANELIIPLKSVAPPPARTRPRPSQLPTPPPMKHTIGSEWLYAKVYTSPRMHNEILAEHVAGLVNGLERITDRWFFIRYTDPHPHLRIRFHGAADQLLIEGVPRLRDWAENLRTDGLVRDWTLDAYEPEVHRYGGPEVLEAAERVFQADSECAMAQLRLQRSKLIDLDTPLLMAFNFVDLCRAMMPGDWGAWLIDAVPRDAHREAFRARRSELRALAARDWQVVVKEATGEALRTVRETRGAALSRYHEALTAQGNGSARDAVHSRAVGSLLHMHHNRLVGIDRDSEGAVHALARGIAELVLGAKRYGR
ncbi:lantibiotic dehydratase [Microtetraspora malaysiensis]|uniref:lantibiotic dehydratase n=1 Tax=Microtetraspora malaysiensis TaxID=161358 RepID=UPI00147086D8|nr:lantibiotic dehydratase [Microtetraspora malaysiensis]